MTTIDEKKALIKKLQGIIFGIMCEFDDFCRENNLTYYLAGGTCLGAVRHQGFIPWDDDADIIMPREDYERFLKLYSQKHSERYGIGALSIDENWKTKHARMWDNTTILRFKNIDVGEIGVFIDILPIDGLPGNSIIRKLHYKYSKLICALGNSCIKTQITEKEGKKFAKRIIGLFTKNKDSRFFFKWMNKNAAKYAFDKSKYVGAIMSACYGERETIEHDLMSKAAYLSFEGREFPVPVGYKTYLENLYGDYMTIPKGAEEQGYVHLDSWDLIIKDE